MIEIAIISTNKNKYSETFIHNHVKYLPFKMHYLFDGYLPRKYSLDKGITEHEIVEETNFVSKLFSKGNRRESEKIALSIESYFKKNKIQVVLCEYGPSGVELMPICEKLNLPLIVHFHGYDAYRKDVLESYGKRYNELFKTAKSLIVVSSDMNQQLLALGCSPEKLRLIPYGIDIKMFGPNVDQKKNYDFVFCGRFVEKKSPLKIIECFKQVVRANPSAKLVMIGDGELWDRSRRFSNELGLSNNIVFTGAIVPREVLEIYQQSKIFINHSVRTNDNDSEGAPVSILEAMSTGLIVIASKHAGIKDVIENGKNGFLVGEGDWDGFTHKLTDTLDKFNEMESVSACAHKTVAENYSLSKNIARLEELINSVITEGKNY